MTSMRSFYNTPVLFDYENKTLIGCPNGTIHSKIPQSITYNYIYTYQDLYKVYNYSNYFAYPSNGCIINNSSVNPSVNTFLLAIMSIGEILLVNNSTSKPNITGIDVLINISNSEEITPYTE